MHVSHSQTTRQVANYQSCGEGSRNFRQYYNPSKKKTKSSLPHYRNSSDIVDHDIHEETETIIREIITKNNPNLRSSKKKKTIKDYTIIEKAYQIQIYARNDKCEGSFLKPS